MITDLSKEIKAQLYDRAKSPLFGAFVVSWGAWNFRTLAALFSEMTFSDKLTYWTSLYSGPHWYLTFAFYPLASAIAFLILYPFPARWIFRYTHTQHAKLKEIQQQIDDKTPLTQEEANALRKASIALQAELQKQIRELIDQNNEYRLRHSSLLADIDRLTKERDAFQERAVKLGEEVIASSASTLTPIPFPNPLEAQPPATTDKSGLAKLTDEQREDLKSRLGNSESLTKVFLALVARGGRETIGRVAQDFDLNPIEVRQAVQALDAAGLGRLYGNVINLTDAGDEFAVQRQLTSLAKAS